MKQIFSKTLFAFALTSLIVIGCRKEKATVDTDTNAASDNAFAENIYTDAGKVVDNTAESSKFLDPQSTVTATVSCPVITIDHPDSITWPKTVTIDFGSTNCLGWNNVYRRGIVTAVFTGPYRAQGTIITITFQNYFVNDNHVEGTKTITNAGSNQSGQMYWNVSIQNAKITRTDGSFMTWNSTRTRTWTQGQSTYGSWADDVYEITGSATGNSFEGNSFSVTVTSPLQVAWGCKWIEAGVLEITPSGKPSRTIDFGTGNCDNVATVTINGNTYTIHMK